eukprot:403210-Amphidinium_carterae.1
MSRANLYFTRAMVVHVDHLPATKQPSLTRDALARISVLNIIYQVDIMGGDFNASVYRYFASGRSLQRCASLADSSLHQVLRAMRTTIDEELQRQCGRIDECWMGDVFQYQMICANTKDVMEKYDQAVRAAFADMTKRRANVVVFSWAHTSVEGKRFQPKKQQHLKGWKAGQEYSINVQGYHLELTSTVLGLRPRDKDFHTLLNVVVNDWANSYKQHFMSDMAKLQNERHTNAEWKQLRIEREQK